jgi:hypothetical protein
MLQHTQHLRMTENQRHRVQKLLKQFYGDICFYCNEPVIWIREIPLKDIVCPEHGTGYIQYRLQGELIKSAIGTIDHIIELTLGGTHELNNLTIACKNCNVLKGLAVRDSQYYPFNPEKHVSVFRLGTEEACILLRTLEDGKIVVIPKRIMEKNLDKELAHR